jgi:hypothetical protein
VAIVHRRIRHGNYLRSRRATLFPPHILKF